MALHIGPTSNYKSEANTFRYWVIEHFDSTDLKGEQKLINDICYVSPSSLI